MGDTIYITGAEGGKGVLYALDLAGKIKWKQPYGTVWTKSYPLSRCQPTVEDGKVYLHSSNGWASCFEAETGKKVWMFDTLKKFRGQNIQWGIAESPLIVGNLFICHPGGRDTAVVALDKKTGGPVWTTKGFSEKSAYCSPLLVRIDSSEQIVTQTEDHIVGIAADSGKVLWKSPQRNKYAVHPNTPVFFDNMIFISSGYGHGSQLLKLSADGSQAKQIWTQPKLDSHHEGVLLIDGYLYGSPSKRKLLCMDPKDGKVVYEVDEVRKASIVYADERLYSYDERGGVVTLLDVSPSGYKVMGQFEAAEGSGPHWAHPVVANGVLYIRHGEALTAYDVKAQ